MSNDTNANEPVPVTPGTMQACNSANGDMDHAKGGDVIFVQGGRGFERRPAFKPEHGRIVFRTADLKDVLVIDGEGECFVHGENVATNLEAFHGFIDWLDQCMASSVPVDHPTKLAHLETTAPSGTRVLVVEDDFGLTMTATRSEPWQLGHGHWCVSLVGRTGGFMIERVFPAP